MNKSQPPAILRLAVLTAAVVTAGAAQLALAQPPKPPIDVAELQSRAAEAFARADTDSDGLVTLAEFTAMERPHRGKRPFSPRSGRRWGEVADSIEGAASEIDAASSTDAASAARKIVRRDALNDELFDLLDSNADDSLSRQEFSADNQRAARQALHAQRAFARLDQNNDGVLTIEEFPPSRLANLDSDGDGTITREELKRGRASRQLRNS